jgi:hypothetical protein
MRIFAAQALAMALLVPVAIAQKPSPPAPAPPPSAPPIRPANAPPTNSGPIQPTGDRVISLMGRIATNDGSPVPNNMLIERVCDGSVRQQVYASYLGNFSMQLGSRTDTFLDASGDPTSQSGATDKNPDSGVSRRELKKCDLRASASGFRYSVISLVNIDNFGSMMDVGVIVVQRAKIDGMPLSGTAYKVPDDARKAYEQGLKAEKHGKPLNARKYFEKAVEIYPKYASAWFHLGTVLQKENQRDEARTAYARATSIDTKFLPPYLSLASMSYEEGDWTEVLNFTGHILDLDPSNHPDVTDYILDLDPLNCAEAYYYNAVANYKLDKIEAAEKSGLKAEHVYLLSRFPQLHLLMAEIFARKNNYASAISEIETYLELTPHATNENQLREELANLKQLNGSVSASEKLNHE